MNEDDIEINWDAISTLRAEISAEDGPGSLGWAGKRTKTKQINEAFMKTLRENKGKIPGELETVPAIIITTTGSKTGEPRSVPLACQVVDGRTFICASMGGSDRNPPWFNNLVKTPEVFVEKDGESYWATASILEGDERDQTFEKIASTLLFFAEYQSNTSRSIPVIELLRKKV